MTLEWVVTSSALILTVVLLRYVFRGKISLRLQYALWVLVLIRLLIPVNIVKSQVSIMNLFPMNIPTMKPSEKVLGDTIAMAPASSTAVGFADKTSDMETADTYDTGTSTDGNANEYANKNTNKYSRLTDWRQLLKYIWIIGTAVVGLGLLISNIHFAGKLKRARYKTGIESYPLSVYITDAITTPCIFGLFRPAIYVTPEALDNKATLHLVLEHETTHWRHKDHLWSFLRCAALALHWYNPLVWFAAILSRRDAELACDEGTIRQIGEENRLEYGRILIEFTCVKRNPIDLLYCATTMTESTRGMRERISLIAQKPKMLLVALIAVLLAAAVAVGCTFTGAKLNASINGTDDESSAIQDEQQVADESEELFKKLDELLGNPDLSEEEIRAARDKLGMETVTVQTVEDFLDSIGPHKVIKLSPGTYRLDELPDGYKGNEYIRIQEERQGSRFGGRELVIHGVENLWIEGLGNERVNLVTGDQEANVLTFDDVNYVYIDNLRIGHWPARGGCYGGVAVFINSDGIRLTNTELFGCGVNGLELCNSRNVFFTRSVITDCSFSIMFLSNSAGIRFEDSAFKENRGVSLVNINGCSDVAFRGCSFENNTAVTDTAALFAIDCAYSPYVYMQDIETTDVASDVLVAGSRFINNEIAFDQFVRAADKNADSLKLENNTFEGGGTRPDVSGQNGGIPSVNEPTEPKGETKRYSYHNLEIELTNVKSDRTETMKDDGGSDWEYTVITCYQGAELTIINADMSDPAYSADGKAHPQWGILIDPDNPFSRIAITDGKQPIELTPDMRGIYSLESHLYVFRFEIYQE